MKLIDFDGLFDEKLSQYIEFILRQNVETYRKYLLRYSREIESVRDRFSVIALQERQKDLRTITALYF